VSTDPISAAYASVGHELRDRIVALIPTQPQILELEDAWGLFKVEGFDCKDLGPSFAQAQWALSAAKAQCRSA
jgi:hypothetical protein